MSLPDFDEEKFKQFVEEELSGDKDTVVHLLQLYIKNSRDHREAIERALLVMDRKAIGVRAHTLKSSSGSLCLIVVQKKAEEIELAIKQGIWSDSELRVQTEDFLRKLDVAISIVTQKVSEYAV